MAAKPHCSSDSMLRSTVVNDTPATNPKQAPKKRKRPTLYDRASTCPAADEAYRLTLACDRVRRKIIRHIREHVGRDRACKCAFCAFIEQANAGFHDYWNTWVAAAMGLFHAIGGADCDRPMSLREVTAIRARVTRRAREDAT